MARNRTTAPAHRAPLLVPHTLQDLRSNLGANNAFIGAEQDFDILLDQLIELRHKHFGVSTEAHAQRSWAEAETLHTQNQNLREIVRFLAGADE